MLSKEGKTMGIACLFGHKWQGCKCEKCGATRDKGHDWDFYKCKKCGKEWLADRDGPELERKLLSQNDLVGRAMILQTLPQAALIYLAENSTNFSVVDMAIPKITDEDQIVRIALKRGNRDISYKAVIFADKIENIEKFVNDSNSTVRSFAKEKLEAAKLVTKEEIEEYISRHRYSMNGYVENYLKKRLKDMEQN